RRCSSWPRLRLRRHRPSAHSSRCSPRRACRRRRTASCESAFRCRRSPSCRARSRAAASRPICWWARMASPEPFASTRRTRCSCPPSINNRRIVMNTKYIGAVFIAAGIGATTVMAQPPTPPDAPDKLFFVENLPPLPMIGGAHIDFIRSEGGVPGPVVKGKPYSARSITESTQTLADGNRITQRNEAVVHRDSEGRTRREQTLSDVGPFRAGEPVTMINIYDPVAGKSYVLDPNERTAREIPQFRMAIAHDQLLLD